MRSRVPPAGVARDNASMLSFGKPGVVLGCLAVGLLWALAAHVTAATGLLTGGNPASLLDFTVAMFPYGAIALSLVALAGIAVSARNESRRLRIVAEGARIDAHTGIPNRVSLDEALARILAPSHPDRAALVLIDLDGFEGLIDRHGRSAADCIVAAVAQRLQSAIRAGDHLSRVSEDVFAVVQESPTGADAARAMAERLLKLIAAPYDVDGLHVVAEAHIGIALKEIGLPPEALLERADLALRAAKAKGRSAYCFHGSEIDQAARHERGTATRLRTGLEKGQFEVHYQPIIRLADHEIIGYEALLRWKDGGHGYVPPSDFIPIAEKTGLIIPIGNWILDQACRAAASMSRNERIAVNISPVQLRSGDLVEAVRTTLHESGLSPDRLELEVTELVLIDEADEVLKTLRDLAALGVKLALDDFGTGYSSLCYLDEHSVDHLKIDRAFVSVMEEKESTRSIVQTIISLAHRLGMKVVAEGVETQAQLQRLQQMGCDEAQGYLLGRPALLSYNGNENGTSTV